jgi:hypothetical protein
MNSRLSRLFQRGYTIFQREFSRWWWIVQRIPIPTESINSNINDHCDHHEEAEYLPRQYSKLPRTILACACAAVSSATW